MEPYHVELRKKAIAWWNTLPEGDKCHYVRHCREKGLIISGAISFLTGREIQIIWKEINKELFISEDQLVGLLKECWEASTDYYDQVIRISDGKSHFDNPTYYDMNEFIKETLKKLKNE